jgi:cell division septal protein FtsQ
VARTGTAQLRRAPHAQGALDAARGTFAGLIAGQRGRRLLVLLVGCVVAAGALYLLVAKTPVSAVSDVRIVGVSGVDARAIERTLDSSAREMSTLSVDDEALLASVAHYKVVRSLQTQASFPHSLVITVDEQPPAAVVDLNGAVTVAANDGVLLGPSFVSNALPHIEGTFRVADGRLDGPHAAGLIAVAGAMPAALGPLVERIYYASHGITAVLRGGLQVYFGDGSLPHAKWISLVRVLTAPSSRGASAIDVRVPSHPAAAFPTGVSGGTSTPALSGEALISSLTAALGGGGQVGTAGATSTSPSPSPTGTTTTTPEPQSSGAAQATPQEATPGATEPPPAG